MDKTKLRIFRAVNENKWLSIEYKNRKGETTSYYIGINAIDAKKGLLYCDIYNPFMGELGSLIGKEKSFVYVDSIIKATVLDDSYYETPKKLSDSLGGDPDLVRYLGLEAVDNNILKYLGECYRHDSDPCILDKSLIGNLDRRDLARPRKLTDDEYGDLLDKVFKKGSGYEAEKLYRYNELAFNLFSIDIGNKQYVVAYKRLFLDFKNRTLVADEKVSFNKSFLLEKDKRMSLSYYLEMSPEDFCKAYNEDERGAISLLEQNYGNGEKTNTRPNAFLLSRNVNHAVDRALEAIYEMDAKGNLTQPLKSFFGRNKGTIGAKHEAGIVVFDGKRINIDQMRVVYSALNSHVTYVQGPPGTGKTETIFNVLLSCYFNSKTALVVSNNNHPVDDILDKFSKNLSSVFNDKPWLFPCIRLGNREEMTEAVVSIRKKISAISKLNYEYLAKAKNYKLYQEKCAESFAGLKDTLSRYERILEVKETISKLGNMEELSKGERPMNSEIKRQLDIQRKELESLKPISDEEVGSKAVGALGNEDFSNFLLSSSLFRLHHLMTPSYAEFRKGIMQEDTKEAVSYLIKYLKDDSNLGRFIAAFPIVLTTNLSSDRLGSATPRFDICIMDEAGQCNIASSLVPIVRARDLLLVGDVNQLQPVTVIEESVEKRYRTLYGVSDDYDYMENSILSTMKRKDTNSKSILLRYHYRCGKSIARFSNDRYYGGQLKLENLNPGKLTYVKVQNAASGERNSYTAEALAVANIVASGHYKDVGIVTPFVNQARLINYILERKGITDVRAGTIHTLQGSEKSTIIMSAAVSMKSSRKTMEWIENNRELLNVGLTRAKDEFIFVGDKEAIDRLSAGEANDLKLLSDYVYAKGDIEVPRKLDASLGFSNGSQNEREFFLTISPYFRKMGAKMRVRRNVKMKDAISRASPSDLGKMGNMEYDVVVEAAGGVLKRRYSPIVAFEIDGGEHIGMKSRAEADRLKEGISKSYGIKVIRIANSQVKDYELIIRLFECISKNIKTVDEVPEQLTLLESSDKQ